MRYAKVQNNVIVNVIEADEKFAKEQGYVPAPDRAGPGYTWGGSAWVPPAVPAVVANERTIRQRAQDGLLTNRDFLALASPSNAQTAAQIKALTRQMSSLIRIALGAFDEVD